MARQQLRGRRRIPRVRATLKAAREHPGRGQHGVSSPRTRATLKNFDASRRRYRQCRIPRVRATLKDGAAGDSRAGHEASHPPHAGYVEGGCTFVARRGRTGRIPRMRATLKVQGGWCAAIPIPPALGTQHSFKPALGPLVGLAHVARHHLGRLVPCVLLDAVARHIRGRGCRCIPRSHRVLDIAPRLRPLPLRACRRRSRRLAHAP
jgi:hypothetical protein